MRITAVSFARSLMATKIATTKDFDLWTADEWSALFNDVHGLKFPFGVDEVAMMRAEILKIGKRVGNVPTVKAGLYYCDKLK